MTTHSKFHIVDMNCRVRGGQDYGSVRSYTEAREKIDDMITSGFRGGCRCPSSGWQIKTCEELARIEAGYFPNEYRMQKELYPIPETVWAEHRCHEFDPNSWDFLIAD